MHVTSGSLVPVPPFDLGRSLRSLEGFSPTEGEQAIASGSVRKATRVGGRTLLFEVRGGDGATIEHPELGYELRKYRLRTGPFEEAGRGSDRSRSSVSGRPCSCCSVDWAGATA